MFAAINIYKPQGMTSHDVVARLRRLYKLKRVGHMGTLDPLAEGVLPVCLGQATRLIEYFPSDKRYTAEITLGKTTTTLDQEGDVLSTVDCSELELSSTILEPILAQFRGMIQQEVPLYSAVHVGGKKLYEIARKDTNAADTVTLPVRKTIIHALTLLDINQTNPAHPVITVDVHCSSGTYIRSLSRDIGSALGCGAYMSHLLRTEHGHFQLNTAVTLETLNDSEDIAQYLQNPVPYLTFPSVVIEDTDLTKRMANGMTVFYPDMAEGFYIALYPNGSPLGVVESVSGKLKPVKIFPVGT